MQFKKILVGILLNLSFLPLAHAEVDLCANVTGNWEGTGKISTIIHGSKIICEYSGTAFVTKTTKAYSADVKMIRTSGGSICPGNAQYTLPGTCDGATGAMVLQDDITHLEGQLYDNGTKASFTGTVTVSFKGKELTASVEQLDLNKV